MNNLHPNTHRVHNTYLVPAYYHATGLHQLAEQLFRDHLVWRPRSVKLAYKAAEAAYKLAKAFNDFILHRQTGARDPTTDQERAIAQANAPIIQDGLEQVQHWLQVYS